MNDQEVKQNDDDNKVQIVDIEELENLLGGGAAATTGGTGGTTSATRVRDTIMCPW